MTTQLRRAWEAWKRIAFWIGDKQATVIYSVLYFVLVGPIALARRLLADPLLFRGRSNSTYWRPRLTTPRTMGEAVRQ